MSHGVALVMPMAGRGTRFHRAGVDVPKPLVELWGKPLFWWATQSVIRAVEVRELVFVVLAEHIQRYAIDKVIKNVYPSARIVALPDVTTGAAQTAALGVAKLQTGGPVALNDCDHAFRAHDLSSIVEQLQQGAEGALLGFRAHTPAYSYVRFDGNGRVVGTVEKQVVSDFAVAGCYLFADPQRFLNCFETYRKDCPYDELFVSGVYNEILRAGGKVLFHELAAHVPFGTPEEHQRVERIDLSFLELDGR